MLRRKAQTWVDNDSTKPLSAARMADLEQGVRNAQRSLTQLRSLTPNPVNRALNPTVPTIAHSTTNPLVSPQTVSAWNSTMVSLQNCVPAEASAGGAYIWNFSSGDNNSAAWAIEFDHYGNDLVLRWRCSPANDLFTAFYILVDDQPITTGQIIPNVTLTSGGIFFLRLTWAAVSQRRVTIRMRNAAPYDVSIPVTHTLSATDRRRPKVACVGASFTKENTPGVVGGFNELDSWTWGFQDMLGVEMFQCARGGTGYATTTPYNDTTRMDNLVKTNPDLIVVEGSGNDDGIAAATLTSAAASFYSACATRLPGVPIIVVGAQPNDAATVNGATRLANLNAVKAAADAAPNVIAFIDPVGSVPTLPGAYTTGASYAVGAKVLYKGAFYQARVAVTSAAATLDTQLWLRLSWLTGTGNSTTPAGDGNRDLFLSNTAHPTPAGQLNIAANISREVRRVLDTL